MDILRLAIALGDSESRRFNKILSTIIVYLLNELNPTDFVSSHVIQSLLNKEYELNFSTQEIETAISSSIDYFAIVEEDHIKKFKLSEKAQKAAKKIVDFSFDDCVELFVKENADSLNSISNFSANQIADIIRNYIYTSFDSDKNELISLIKADFTNTVSCKKRFDKTQISVIRLFLDWDNDKKNKLVFNVVRFAYDYCILTLKENANESMFSYKKLYLDTNVIFSLTGINGLERLQSTRFFIEKCRELHSQLFYTSETANECVNTLRHLIENMAAIIKKDSFLSYDELRAVFPSSNPAALYSLYLDWLKGHPSRNGDYENFAVHMLNRLNDTLETLTLKPIEKHFISTNESTIALCQMSIRKYKEKLGRKHSESAAYTDACNYVYIDSIRDKTTITLSKQNSFFISSDSGLCKWASEQCAGYVSLFLQPSTMYSLMLRFSSRTKNDYRSFNTFLSLRLANDYIVENDYQAKEEMINAINELDVPDNAKKAILYSANNQLNSVIQKTDKPIELAKVEETVKNAVDGFYEEFSARKEKEKEEAVEVVKKENYKKGSEEAVYSLSVSKANKIMKRRIFFGWLVSAIFSTAFLVAFAFMIYIFIKEQTINTYTGWILAFVSLLSLIPFIITLIKNIRNSLFNTNYANILNKEISKNKKIVSKQNDH